MTIRVRGDVFGNDAEAIFTNVEDAVAHLVAHPTFEIVPRDVPVRPYGDVEGNVPDDMGEAEFNEKNAEMIAVLRRAFDKFKRVVSITSASSYAMKRWSMHWHSVDSYVPSIQHAKAFARDLYAELMFPAGIKGDLAPYNNDQKFRNGNTPTAKGQVRPFELVQGEWKDTFITHIPETADLIQFDLPVEKHTSGEITKVEDAELVPLLDCISAEDWTSYDTCLRLVWAMCSCGASPSLIHSYCEKATNYGFRWVEDLIHRHNVEKSPALSFLRKHAKLGNPARYSELVFGDKTDSQPYIEEMMRLTEDEYTSFDSGRYLMQLPDEPTLAVKCQMGCGKTHEMKRILKNMVKKNPAVRILVFSGRRTWSDHIHAELDGLGFVHYEKYKTEQFEKKKGKTTEIKADRLVLQMSPTAMSLIRGLSYDYVVVDECETVLTMMSPLSIWKNTTDWIAMGTTFEKLMRETKRVLFMDAFLNDRTMDMLRELRPTPVHTIINTTQPHNKKCVYYDGKPEFFTALGSKLIGEKKRGACIWGTVKAGNEFQEKIEGRVKSVFYHGKSDAKIKARDMADVNTSWATYQAVSYTGTITVGINYTNKENPFDFLSLYATCFGGSARDFAQALHRAREVKDNKILAYVDKATDFRVSCEPGMEAQEKLWSAERNLRKSILEKLGENVEEYTTLPEWWKKVIMRNRNERVVNSKFFYDTMMAYMQLCGIENVDTILASAEKKKVGGGSSLVPVAEVRDIENEEAEWLHNNRRSLSEEDHYALEKYILKEKVVSVNQELWELWNTNKGVINRAYDVVHRTPTDLFEREDHKVLDLVNKNIARMEVIQNCKLDWTASWERPIEEMPDLNIHAFTLRQRSEKDGAEQHWREVSRAFQGFGLNLVVKQKKWKRNGSAGYSYSVAFQREASVIHHIHPKLSVADIFGQ